jgi:hypothetical protein
VSKVYSTSLKKGQTILLNVTVSNIPSIIGCDVNLAFNSSVLQVTTGNRKGYLIGNTRFDIYEGSFFTTVSGSTIFLLNGVNNAHGSINAIYEGFTKTGVNASGSGILASINFTCVNANTNTFINVMNNSILLKNSTANIQNQIVNGFVTANPPPAPPSVWTELWFQATLIVIVIEIIIVVLGILLTLRGWRAQAETEIKERDELDELLG